MKLTSFNKALCPVTLRYSFLFFSIKEGTEGSKTENRGRDEKWRWLGLTLKSIAIASGIFVHGLCWEAIESRRWGGGARPQGARHTALPSQCSGPASTSRLSSERKRISSCHLHEGADRQTNSLYNIFFLKSNTNRLLHLESLIQRVLKCWLASFGEVNPPWATLHLPDSWERASLPEVLFVHWEWMCLNSMVSVS